MQHQESLINQKSPLQTSLSTSPQISFQSYQPPPLPPPPRPLLQKEKLDSLKQQINDQLSSNSSDVTGSSPTANDSLDCKFGVLSSSSSSGLLASNNPTSIQKNLDKKKIKLTASESKLASPHVDSKQSQVSSPLRNQSGSLNKLSSYTFRDDVPYSPAQLIYKENSFDLAVSTLSDIFQTSIHNQQHPVICLENEVIIGELAALRSTTVTLHFFITRPGIFELARIAIHDKLSQTVYEQPLFFPLSVLCIQQ
ncbi:MAG: hypothetical protein EZS28_006563 [Streblomastix strix]|uniref:Uncharacterized protein n=1 Tax=Streblomastix strix TaxID=222440 RepID=A0A5J4WUQ8_9EUKA|nr:MAG: hypothetical protein EZS28_006563 [Streblomastix strix]